MKRLDKERDKLKQEQDKLNDQLRAAREETTKAERVKRELLAKSENERRTWEGKLLGMEREVARHQALSAAGEKETKKLRDELAALRRQATESAESSAREETSKRATRQELMNAREEIETLKNDVAKARREAGERFEGRVRELEESNSALMGQLLQLDQAGEERDQLSVLVDKLTGELEAAKRASEHKDTESGSVQHLEDAYAKASADLLSTTEYVHKLEEQLRLAQEEAEDAKAVLAEGSDEVATRLEAKERELTELLTAVNSEDPAKWPAALQTRLSEHRAEVGRVRAALVSAQADAAEAAEKHAKEMSRMEREVKSYQAALRDEAVRAQKKIGGLETSIALAEEVSAARLQDIKEGSARAHELEKKVESLTQRVPDGIEGVDLLYLKNVVLKYIENRQSVEETSALLPVIATILQFTSEEFARCTKADAQSNVVGGLGLLAGIVGGFGGPAAASRGKAPPRR